MGSISHYIFRTTFGAFLLVLISLTAVIWVTQALRDIDLMTSQGQTVLVFIGITGLIVPLLVLVIAPIVQPGRFTAIDAGVTIHIRERLRNGQLVGILLDDRRNPNERITVLSDTGELLDNDNGTFLVLQKGVVQRQEVGKSEPAMVEFDRYGFDLSQFSGGAQAVKYSIRERYLWQLLFPDPKDPYYLEQPGSFRAELHDRLVAPLYPIAFVVIAFAYLGAPRTNRQSRSLSMVGAITGVALLRLIGFASTVFGATTPWMLSLQYIGFVVAFGGGLFVIHRGLILEPPAFLTNWLAALSARVAQRLATP